MYTDDALVRWFINGAKSSIIGEKTIRVVDSVPAIYLLEFSVPVAVFHPNIYTPISELVGGEDEIFEDEDSNVFASENEIYIKFESGSMSEASVLRLMIDEVDDFEDEDETGTVLEESVPVFPVMKQLDKDKIVAVSGGITRVAVNVLFTKNDWFTVRGIVYNSTSNEAFSSLWGTLYAGGPSEFMKLSPAHEIDLGSSYDDYVSLALPDATGKQTWVSQIMIDIPTHHNDISGVYKIIAHHKTEDGDSDYLIESSLEQSFLLQRGGQEHGPFPVGFLQFDGGKNYSQHTCQIGAKCIVSCRVFGSNIEHLDLEHKNLASEFVMLAEEHVEIGAFEGLVSAVVDSRDPDKSGTYTCEAVSGATKIQKEIDVIITN
ncbi:uncharacterized protein LOC131952179 isoform X2 [Physella acuta]|nr:uncharacterized protein LOC131952179 isoform X2 [Physella acuta]